MTDYITHGRRPHRSLPDPAHVDQRVRPMVHSATHRASFPPARPPAYPAPRTSHPPAGQWSPAGTSPAWEQRYVTPQRPMFAVSPGYAPTPIVARARPSRRWGLIVAALLLSGPLFAGFAMYFGLQVDRRWQAGDVAGAEKASRLAMIWSVVGIAVGSIVVLMVVLLLGLGRAIAPAAGGPAAGPAPAAAVAPPAVAPAPPVVATATATGVVDPTLERPAVLDPLQRFAFDGMTAGLQDAADRLARGQDPTFSCVPVLVFAEDPASNLGAVSDKAREQCGREIPLAWAAQQLDAAAAKVGAAQAVVECATSFVSLDTVERRFADPRVAELRARAASVCP